MDRNVTDQNIITELSRRAIRKGLSVRLMACGMSMFPCIWPREMVTFRPLGDGERLQTGALVVIDQGVGKKFILHRLIGYSGGKVNTRGDSVGHMDKAWAEGEILGVVTHIEGRFTHCRRRVSANGGLYARLMLATAPLSYMVNGLLARCVSWSTRLIRKPRRKTTIPT